MSQIRRMIILKKKQNSAINVLLSFNSQKSEVNYQSLTFFDFLFQQRINTRLEGVPTDFTVFALKQEVADMYSTKEQLERELKKINVSQYWLTCRCVTNECAFDSQSKGCEFEF